VSIIDTLPPDTRAKIRRGDRGIRDDLRILPEAEAAGWTVEFRNNHWHNAASFKRGDLCVWFVAGRHFVGWHSAVLVEGRWTQHKDHPSLREALGL
jgi:hypothetical protein